MYPTVTLLWGNRCSFLTASLACFSRSLSDLRIEIALIRNPLTTFGVTGYLGVYCLRI